MQFAALAVTCFITLCIAKEKINVCKTFNDYSSLYNNPNCWYNPDVVSTTPQMIKRYGYPLEEYETITKDGYILKVYRIPQKGLTAKGVVFLLHPALLSSTVYTDLGNQSLAFFLWKQGYDVWLGNSRGTIYSPKHVYLSQQNDSNKYWNFSFHEFGVYDIPAVIDLSREITKYKHKISFIGHSVSTSAALVYASLQPDHAQKNVELITLWSPMAFMGHGYSLAGITKDIMNSIMDKAEKNNVTYTPPYGGLIHRSIKDFCIHNIKLCYNIYELIFGRSRNTRSDWFPIFLSQAFAGFPLKALTHNQQIINARGRFQYYDYGPKLNSFYYHSEIPPAYPIENITTPVYIVSGENDAMSPPKDGNNLYNQLRRDIRYGINVIPYNHMDFQYGGDILKILYKPTLKMIQKAQYLKK